jgi:hypothetical protein
MELKNNIFNRMSRPGSAYQLALLRIMFGVQILFSSTSKVFEFLQQAPGTNYTRTIFSGQVQEFINQNLVNSLQLSVQVLSVFMILGLFTRIVLPILTITFILLFSFLYSKFDAPIPWIYIWFPLIVFSISDVSRVWSVDSIIKKSIDKKSLSDSDFRWPIELLLGWWAYIYFAAGLAKIWPAFKGMGWLDGGTSHGIMYDRYLDSALHFLFERPLFDYSENGLIFSFLTIGALVIELACVFLYFTDRYNLFILFLVISMHSFLFLTGVPGFGVLSIILGISLINPRYFSKFIEH